MTTRAAKSARVVFCALVAFGSMPAFAILLTSCGGGGGTAATPRRNDSQPPPAAMTVVTTSLPDGYTNRYYEQALKVTGGVPPYEWSMSGLPPGLGLGVSTGWVIMGYPTQAGSFNPTFQVHDSQSRTASGSFALLIKESIRVVPGELPEGQVNLPYSHTLQAAGGDPPYTWSWTALPGGVLPPGLSMSGSGTISGVPTQGGWFGFDATVRDSKLQSAALSLWILIKSLGVATQWLPPAYQNEPYSQMLQADGGQPPFVWRVEQGANLPPGMNLASTGQFSGMPTASGSFPFVVNVQDSSGQTAAGSLSLFVASPLTITTRQLADGNIGNPYWANLEATGGVGGYEWGLEPGSNLPDGVNLEAWGNFSGVPIASGTFDLAVRVTDWGSPRHTASQALTLFIDDKLTILPTGQPDGIVTRAYNYALQALGGTPPYTWSIVGGNTAGVFAINPSTGELSGTPQIGQDGAYVLNIRVADASSPIQTATKDFGIQVLPPPTFLTTSLPDGSPDVDYYAEVLIEGGRTPRTVRIVSGSIPQGLTLSDPLFYGHFLISGRAVSTGSFNFTLELADATSPPLTATQEFQLKVNERLAITTTSLPNGSFAEPYNAILTATGGVPPYVWSGYLPQDLELDPATGEIFGNPTTWGTNMLASVTVRDSAVFPQTARRSFTITVKSVLRINTRVLPPVRLGAPFAVELRAYGGSGTYNWRIASGRLPQGLILNSSTGEIVGAPTAEEDQTFTLRVDDTGSPAQFDERSLTLRVLREPGRNDAITTATPLSDGRYQASLSPVADPIFGPVNPDTDYYRLTALPGSVVVIETETQDPTLTSPADLVMEILNADGERLTTCRMMEDYGGLYDDPCLNDDSAFGTDLDPKLRLRVVGTPGTPATFYLHILDWTGNARPDFTYYLYIFGTN